MKMKDKKDYKYTFWAKQDYRLNHIQENIELLIYAALCLFVPFFIGHPQIVVGVIVNAALVMSALNIKGFKLLPIILLPSVGVLSRGLIFGTYTPLLLLMMPFIWVGNTIFVYAFKKLNVQKKMNKWLTLGIGSVAKSAFLFGFAYLFFSLGILPQPFLIAMGALQFGTAIGGGVIALGAQFLKRKVVK